jgi:hypothetical protein
MEPVAAALAVSAFECVGSVAVLKPQCNLVSHEGPHAAPFTQVSISLELKYGVGSVSHVVVRHKPSTARRLVEFNSRDIGVVLTCHRAGFSAPVHKVSRF